jgi:hypothetical protein
MDSAKIKEKRFFYMAKLSFTLAVDPLSIF